MALGSATTRRTALRRRVTRCIAACLLIGALPAAAFDLPSVSATHAPPPMTEYRIPGAQPGWADSGPKGITAGPDGNLWFVELWGSRVGRISTAGAMTFWPLPTQSSRPHDITAGPDGALWFTEGAGRIGRITTNGVITEYGLAVGSTPAGITAGPDGAVWWVDPKRDVVGRITPDGATTEYPLPPPTVPNTACRCPAEIAAGSDGNLWFTQQTGNSIGRMTTSGELTEFPIPTQRSSPFGIAAGPDGNIWFTERYGDKIGRITPAGVITEFPVPRPDSVPGGITAGPDGNIWFTDEGGEEDQIGTITPAGVIMSYRIPTLQSNPYGIVAGPDGNMWFTEFTADAVGRATIDHRAPVMRAPLHGLVEAAPETSRVPVRVSWSGTDDGSGVARYELQMRTDSGGYTAVKLASATSTTATPQLAPGHTYRFRARAVDRAGNWSGWAEGASFRLSAIQETSTAVRYTGTWRNEAISSAYGGTRKYATAAGATARTTFSGRQVAWVANRSTDRGQARVYLDGVLIKTIDLYAPSAQARQVVFTRSWAQAGTHTIEIRVVGTSGRPRTDVDAFVVIN